jgi:Mn-containing catalase
LAALFPQFTVAMIIAHEQNFFQAFRRSLISRKRACIKKCILPKLTENSHTILTGRYFMFKHEKQLFHPVGVERPNPQYAALLQEQLGGANGELKAAMQYMSQSFRIKDQTIKDLFLDIAAEELGHMEMVAQTINLLNGHDVNSASVSAGEIQTHVLLGLNPGLINASGYSWTSDYVTVTGDLCADLLSNIASEQRAKVVYEYLYRQINDQKVRETIDFLLNREEAHNAMFREAFNKVQDTGSNQDFGTTKAAKMYFSMSNPSTNSTFPNTEVTPPSFQ